MKKYQIKLQEIKHIVSANPDMKISNREVSDINNNDCDSFITYQLEMWLRGTKVIRKWIKRIAGQN